MDWKEFERLFQAAADLPPGERSAFLDRESADPEFRRELESVLREADSNAGGFLEGLIVQETLEDRAGERLGPYRIEREIGHGGMGEVYLAHRADEEYRQQVAIKMVRSFGSAGLLSRFRQERQILARLDHPNVSRLLDGGSTSDHLPYLVMEYVDGVPIDEYCETHQLGVEERCRLLLPICDAVHHAHQHLIVHRDIKPSNILVTPAGVPKLLDFGIAKLLDTPVEGGMTATVFRVPLTPDYATPEQVTGQPITTVTDVYLLGGVLFRLLTGAKPHALASYSLEELDRVICRAGVPHPSGAKPEWRSRLKGDLDNIVLRAMHPQPDQRYRSAEQLREDLQRYLDGRPVAARPDTLGYRTRKLLGRYPWTAAAVLAAVLATVAGVSASLHEARRAEHRFQQVRNLAKTFVFDVHDEIAELPGATKARQKIVSTALVYLESLFEDAKDDPDLAQELAAAYVKIGYVQGLSYTSNLADFSGAMKSYRRAETLLSAPSLRNSLPAHIALIDVYTSIADVQSTQGRAQEAVATLRQARALAAAELPRRPENAELINANGEIENALSRALVAAGDLQAAFEAGKSAIRFAEKLVALAPEKESYGKLADAASSMGQIQTQIGQQQAAVETFRKSLEARRELVQRAPDNIPYLRALMLSYGHLGDVLGYRFGEHLGDLEGARDSFQEALRIAQSLARKDPADEKARVDVANAQLRLGSVLLDMGDARGLPMLLEAESVNEALRLRNPAVVRFQIVATALNKRIGQALADQGRTADAVRRLRNSCTLSAQLAAKNPRAVSTRVQLAAARLRLAMLLASTGAGRPEAEQLADLVAGEVDAEPTRIGVGWSRAQFYGDLGRLYSKLGESAKASRYLELSLDAWKKANSDGGLARLASSESGRLSRELAALKRQPAR